MQGLLTSRFVTPRDRTTFHGGTSFTRNPVKRLCLIELITVSDILSCHMFGSHVIILLKYRFMFPDIYITLGGETK